MNNYHFYQEEAKGKYSVIFKARKKRKLDFVAIKRIQKTRKKKVLNEARIFTELNHPNIIKFYDYIQSKNHMWTVTQYCPGGDLLKLIQQDKNLPQNVVRNFIIEILRGLQHCHTNGIIVCDLKLASILVNEYGKVKISDLGSAKTLVDLLHNENQTKKGTPSYMAPQLFLREGVYSFESDLWSVGCMMYELAQGNPPFVSATYQDIATLAHTATTPKVQDFSSDFNNLLELLLAKKPQQRIRWQDIAKHKWIGNQMPVIEMPEQPHMIEYLKKEKENNLKFLRASQQFQKQAYGSHKLGMADDRRGQFIFENNEVMDNMNDYDNDYDPEQYIELNAKQVTATAFTKKKEKNNDKRGKKEKNEVLEDSTNINMFLEPINKKNLRPLSDIIQHNSDNAVKPIIGNKDIQVIQSFKFNKKSLGFEYIDPQTLAQGIVNNQMKEELGFIFDGMIGDEKYNVMGYFQSIIQNSDVANELFKQEFIRLYLKLLKTYKQANLRAKMFEVLGFLVRHATVIDPKIIKHGIINAFLEGATKDKSEKVRRKAMAALGQLLFYGATQVDEDIKEWDFSLNLIHSLLKILKNTQEDQIVKIYCCKAIQNITAQAKQIGLKFAQIDGLLVLISCFVSTTNQGFKTCICCCFHHIMLLNSSLRQIFLQKVGINNIIQVFKSSESSAKNMQIILWILLSQFSKTKTSRISKLYLEDQNLFKAILHKLDKTTSSVVKGRIYLYLYFFLETNPKKSIMLLQNSNMVTINSNKLFSMLEKQNNSGNHEKQNKYQTQCIHYILVWLQEKYHDIIKFVHEDIKKIIAKMQGGYNAMGSKKSTGYCGMLWHMINCPIFQQLFSTQSNVQALLSILSLLDSIPVSEASNADSVSLGNLQSIKSIYMQILEKLTNNPAITQKLQDYYATKALPFLVGKILKSNYPDIKFNCMKFFVYLVSFYMNEQYIYDSTILSTTSNKIISLVNNHLFPQIDAILTKNHGQVVPTMAMKVIAVLFQINDSFARRFYELKKINLVLDNDFYKENSNVNVLKFIQKIIKFEPEIGNKAVPEWITKIRLQTFNILILYLNTGQQIFLQYPLQILKELVRINGSNWKQDDVDSLWQMILPLQGHEDIIIRQKAENLIRKLLQLGRYGARGKWEIKEKKGLENYEKYIQVSGKPKDPKLVEQFTNKSSKNRYV